MPRHAYWPKRQAFPDPNRTYIKTWGNGSTADEADLCRCGYC